MSILKKRRKSGNGACADCGHYRTQHTKGGDVCVAKVLIADGAREFEEYCPCSRFVECVGYERTNSTKALLRCKTKVEEEKRRRSR